MIKKKGLLIRHDDAIGVNIAAQKYYYHPVTLRRWIKRKIVPGFRFRNRFYIYEKQLKEYIETL